MYRGIVLSLLAGLWVSVAAAEPVWNFAPPAPPQIKFPAGIRSTEQGVEFDALSGMRQLKLPAAITSPVRISFQVRELTPPQKADGHWGVLFNDGEKTRGHLFSRGSNLEFLCGKQHLHLGKTTPPADGQPLTFSVVVLPHKVMPELSKTALSSATADLLPADQLTFYAYNRHVKFSDLKIEPVETAADQPVRTVLNETFDAGNTPGVSGQAFEFRSDKSPWSFGKDTAAEQGKLRIAAAKGYGEAILTVPPLKEFTLSFLLTRTDQTAPDGHAGVFLCGPDKQFVRLFLTGSVWGVMAQEKTRYLPKSGDHPAAVHCRIAVKDGRLTLNCEGKDVVADIPLPFAVNRFKFNGYKADAAIEQLNIESPGFEYAAAFDAPKTAALPSAWPLGRQDGKSGAILFWYRSGYDAKDDLKPIPLLKALDKDGKTVVGFSLTNWLGAVIGRREGAPVELTRIGRLNYFKGDWNHIALTWRDDGAVRLFLNGLPYNASYEWRKESADVPNARFDAMEKLELPKESGGAFDDVKVLTGSAGNREVYAEYRKHMPVDLVIRDAVALADTPSAPGVRLAPGGSLVTPNPCGESAAAIPAEIGFKLELLDANGKPLDSLEKQLTVDRPLDIALPERTLPAGEYRLRCTVTGKNGVVQRSFLYRSLLPEPPRRADKSALKAGKLVCEYDLSQNDPEGLLKTGVAERKNGYQEAGAHKGDRFAFPIPIPEQYRCGKNPLLLEITWPDDKPRNMGWYLYAESTRISHHRDRLQGGVQAGGEYFNSGKTVTCRYLFYPMTARYLFEARTLADDAPAAVARVRFYELPEGLPSLAVRSPGKLEPRRFGHIDEDQTLETSLARDNPEMMKFENRVKMITDRLLDYFDYTGQNAFHYPVLRYGSMVYYSREGTAGCPEVLAGQRGELPYFIEALRRRGKQFTGCFSLFNLPEFDKEKELDGVSPIRGEMILRDRNGDEALGFGTHVPIANFIHPEVQKRYLRHVRELLDVHGRQPGFNGFDYWVSTFGWKTLETGYGDYTVGRFTADTGIPVPKTGRYEFLTGKCRDRWLNWRARQVTEFVRALRRLLDEYNPELPLYVTYPINSFEGQLREPYAEFGVEIPALAAIGRVRVGQTFPQTLERWNAHWGREPSRFNDVLYDPAFYREGGRNGLDSASLFLNYFETFTPSPDNENFRSYFQNADPKPFGRWFLKAPVFNVAVLDVREILIGGQPLGSWGRDDEIREFTQAFCALPRLPFHTVKGSPDPVAVRYLETEDGTYFYLANIIPFAGKVRVDFATPPTRIVDLSAGQPVRGDEFELKPFELRSFLVPAEKDAIVSFRFDPVPECRARYEQELSRIQSEIAALKRNGIACAGAEKAAAELRKAIDDGHFAEAHRLAFLLDIRNLHRSVAHLEETTRQARMIRENRYAVNCGSSRFCTTGDGRLFFPDRRWTEGADYGWVGNCNCVIREVDKMKPSPVRELYRSEAYDIDGYRFRLANGVYTVRLYLKCGWIRGFKPGEFVFSVFADGRELCRNLDLHRQSEGDFERPLVLEFDDVKVTDGVLNLVFKADKQKGNVRLCNAIEIFPAGAREKQNGSN